MSLFHSDVEYQEEDDRIVYGRHLGELQAMREILLDITRQTKKMNVSRLSELERTHVERWRRNQFVYRCDRLGLNPSAYIVGVGLNASLNVMNSEIKSFLCALSRMEDQ